MASYLHISPIKVKVIQCEQTFQTFENYPRTSAVYLTITVAT